MPTKKVKQVERIYHRIVKMKQFIGGILSGIFLSTKFDFTEHVKTIEDYCMNELKKIKKK